MARRGAVGLALVGCAMILAGCGSTPKVIHQSSTQPQLSSLLDHTSLMITVDPTATSALDAALRVVQREAPHLQITVHTIPLDAVAQTMLAGGTELLVTGLAPPAPLVAQSGLAEWPYAPEELTVAVNLGATTGLVLSETTLADLLAGRITVWDDTAIARLNPSLALPPVPVSVAPIQRDSMEAVWLSSLGLSPQDIGSRTSSACATTVGCMELLINQVPSDAASILDAIQTARTPPETAYPLRSAAAAFVEPQPANPAGELAALLVAQTLVEQGSQPAPQRQVELQRLDAEITTLENQIP